MQDTRVGDLAVSGARDDDREIRQMAADWMRAESNRDLSHLLRMVTSDVVFLRPRASAIEGRQALEDFYRQLWSQFDLEHKISTQEVRVAGDFAFTRTREEFTLTMRKGGQIFRLSGNSMAILRRGSDGRWRFSRGMTNALPGTDRDLAGG